MRKKLNLRQKNFLVYGLGLTGISVVKYLKKLNVQNLYVWDDIKKNKKLSKKNKIIKFNKIINIVDYIVVSPGIDFEKSIFKNQMKLNFSKIITDIDLFYLTQSNFKSIVVTGTNGKSTTCKIIEHLLLKNKFNVKIGGNIGQPILNLRLKKNSHVIIEASSFQLEYSKFIKPDFALMLNVTPDHLDRHKTMNKYISAKMKIFSLQSKNHFALIENKKIIKRFKKKSYLSKLHIVNKNNYAKNIKNDYLSSDINKKNMIFVYELSKILKINRKSFLTSFEHFKGLSHRHEVFLKRKNITFINDSKATSFQATFSALKNNKNIYWIVGGQPKIKDKFFLKDLKKNINKAYIIGKNTSYFKNQLNRNIKFSISNTLKKSLIEIFKDQQNINNQSTVLLSPASASYDQYKNFMQRGDEFKRLAFFYAKKFL